MTSLDGLGLGLGTVSTEGDNRRTLVICANDSGVSRIPEMIKSLYVNDIKSMLINVLPVTSCSTFLTFATTTATFGSSSTAKDHFRFLEKYQVSDIYCMLVEAWFFDYIFVEKKQTILQVSLFQAGFNGQTC